MQINFEYIRWKNLLSTGNQWTEIQLNRSKSTLIVGKNGAGKSTFLDALMYLLYGKPYRDINKPQMVNSISGKGLLVEGQFRIGKKKYFVRRGDWPGIFEVHVNNEMIKPTASSVDDQKNFVKNILKISDKSFRQVVVLGSANYIPFMQLQTGDRRKIIEDLLDIQIFSVMNSLLSKKVSTNKSEILEVDTQLRIVQSRIDLGKKHIEELRQNNEDLIAQRHAKINETNDDVHECLVIIKDLSSRAKELTASLEARARVTNKIDKIREMERQLVERSKKLRKDIQFFMDNEDCPTCKQGIQHDFREHAKAIRSSKLGEVNSAIQKLDDEYKKMIARLEEIGDVNEQIALLNQQIAQNNNSIAFHNRNILALRQEIEELRTKSEKLATDQTDLTDNLKELGVQNKLKEKLIKHQSVLEIASVLLKDSGIKTRIIKQYVPIMNKLINKYLAQMDFFANFELDESFSEKIKSRHRDEFSYSNFSEGEKARIDLALLFTWRAIAKLRNSAGANILVMDEVFDGSLDASGVDELLKIIETVTGDAHVFVISHKDTMFDKFHSIIEFEKVKNFSQIVKR